DGARLKPLIGELHTLGCRVSLFMDPDVEQIKRVVETGADRIELYTQPYAEAYEHGDYQNVWTQYAESAEAARSAGLGVHAGHDLNLHNLAKFLEIPNIDEVSIGHALIADALDMGLTAAVKTYLA